MRLPEIPKRGECPRALELQLDERLAVRVAEDIHGAGIEGVRLAESLAALSLLRRLCERR